MNGIHDMGGMQNMGTLPTAEGPWPFAAAWEGLALALNLAMILAGYYRVDESRRSNEATPLDVYAAGSYFERWVHGLDAMMVEKNVLTREEIEIGRSLRDDGAALPPVPPPVIDFITSNPLSAFAPTDKAARFKAGDRVIARNFQPKGHTRLPRYVRGKPGTIVRYQGAFLLPDANAHGMHDVVDHSWLVRFEARVLWGGMSGNDAVYLTLFDSYIEDVP
jgi:nitrile hydratase